MKIGVCEGVDEKWCFIKNAHYATIPKIGEQIVLNNHIYKVKEVKYFPLNEIKDDDMVATILCSRLQ